MKFWTQILLGALLLNIFIEPVSLLTQLSNIIRLNQTPSTKHSLSQLSLSEEAFQTHVEPDGKEIVWQDLRYDIQKTQQQPDKSYILTVYADHEETGLLDFIQSWVKKNSDDSGTSHPQTLKSSFSPESECPKLLTFQRTFLIQSVFYHNFMAATIKRSMMPETPPPCRL